MRISSLPAPQDREVGVRNTINHEPRVSAHPEDPALLMVDPKMVELSVYNTLPHLRHKVITDNRDAAAVLSGR